MSEARAEAAATPVKQNGNAAERAAGMLREAASLLRSGYGHPHHSPRLDQIEAHLANLASLISELPQAEDNRADYAKRLVEQYRTRQLPPHLPDHAELLLSQELERTGR